MVRIWYIENNRKARDGILRDSTAKAIIQVLLAGIRARVVTSGSYDKVESE